MKLDLGFVRRQFPAFVEPSLDQQAFFENAGGSYPCAAVVERLNEYYRRLKVQPYYAFRASTEAGEWMDASRVRLAEYLGVTPQEVHFGPSTSQNTYVLARSLPRAIQAGRRDHRHQSGPRGEQWLLATSRGAAVSWCASGALTPLPECWTCRNSSSS